MSPPDHRFRIGPRWAISAAIATMAIAAMGIASTARAQSPAPITGPAAAATDPAITGPIPDRLEDWTGIEQRFRDAAAGGTGPAAATDGGRGLVLTAADIRAVVKLNLDRLRTCYEAVLTEDPKAGGRLVAYFEIDGSGRVAAARVSGPTTAPLPVQTCVLDGIRGLRFPPPGDPPVPVIYPLRLVPVTPPTEGTTAPAPPGIPAAPPGDRP